MGLDYAYELIAERQSADRLVRAVCEHLAPKDRTRLLASLGIPDLLQQVERDEFERRLLAQGEKHFCLGFLFPEDEHLSDYSKKWPCPVDDGRVEVGCVWTSIQCGSRFVILRAAAATTGMSLLFERSPSVRATFREAGRAGHALLVLLDDEREDFAAIWPYQGRFAPSSEYASFETEAGNLKIDDYCQDLITSAQRKLRNQPGDPGT